MHFTEEEIREQGARFEEALRNASKELGSEAPTLSEIQNWMIENHVDRPEVLELILRKMGPGQKAGKKKMP